MGQKKKCSECKWFSYFVNPETGRKKPTEKGVCNFPLPWPTVWPAYIDNPPYKPQNRIWDTGGHNCKTYTPSDKHMNAGESPRLPSQSTLEGFTGHEADTTPPTTSKANR